MEEKHLSERDSLLLIQQMIDTAKKEQKDDGKGWIVWGWMLLLASILTVLNLRQEWFSNTFFFWNAFGLIAFILLVWESAQFFFLKRQRVKTYTGDLFKKLNVGFFISLLFIIIAMNAGESVISKKLGYFDGTFVRYGFALLINLYSFWILIYGTALDFKPSVIGAYFSWALGLTALLFTSDFETVMLLHAAAVLVGYIIPGHIANREFRKIANRDKALERV